jgi:tetratricopeptide (TPR) repeat protein
MNYSVVCSVLVCFLMPFLVNGQINKPSLSPRIVTEQRVGLATIKLNYGQPNMQGRKIFGALIPYGRLWRTGANSSTKISIDQTVTFAGEKIPAGDYSLYSIPGEKIWTIIINNNTKHWGAAGYDKTEDLVRFELPALKLKDKRETFSIHFESFDANGANLIITWENTKIAIPIFIDSDELIYKEIDTKITQATGDISAQTYFDAAQFYYHKEKDLDQAVLWFEKAMAMRPSAFWYIYYRAELAFHLKDYAAANEYTKKCLKLAEASTSSDFGYLSKCKLLLEKIEKIEKK